jgi:lysophospholipase L1-like esterase
MSLPRRLYQLTILGLVFLSTAGLVGEAQAQLRIMPLGDSITDGFNVPGGYRINLWNAFPEIELDAVFVGSLSNGPPELGSQQHEGHNGWRIEMISNQINGWLETYQPDLILLNIGSNDIIMNYFLETIGDRLDYLLDQITYQLPNSVVIVAMITPLADPALDLQVVRYNQLVSDIVTFKADEGRNVFLVDMHNAGVTLADGVHPTRAGYDVMAAVWFDAIVSLYGG